MTMKCWVASATAASSLLLLPAVRAQTSNPTPVSVADTITVQGRGEVRVTPDIAIVTLGVQNSGAEASGVAQENATRTTRVIAAVRALGIAEKDVRTADYSVQPQYDYRPQEQGKPPVLAGYQVTNTVRVTVRKIADAGKVLDAGLKAGANVAGGIAFDLDDATEAKAKDEALAKAVAQAQRKAQVLATAAGSAAVQLVTLNEVVAENGPRPMLADVAMLRAPAASQTPVQPGEQVVVAVVDARYRTNGFPSPLSPRR